MPPAAMPKDSNPVTAPQSGIMNNSAGQQHKSKDGDLRSALLRGGQGSGVGRRRHVPKSKISERTKVRVVAARRESGGSSGSEPGSDLVEVSDHEAPWSVCRPEAPAAGSHYYTPSLTSGSSALSSDDSLASSIERFRDDFDTFKCKLRIFGESLALCKCIARDFGGRLGGMERRLRSLETRHIRDKTHNNYTAIIQKNKLLSTKTKEYVQFFRLRN